MEYCRRTQLPIQINGYIKRTSTGCFDLWQTVLVRFIVPGSKEEALLLGGVRGRAPILLLIEHHGHLFAGDEHIAGFGAIGFGDDAAVLHFINEPSGAGIADAHAALEH